jgi:hypothetical protein
VILDIPGNVRSQISGEALAIEPETLVLTVGAKGARPGGISRASAPPTLETPVRHHLGRNSLGDPKPHARGELGLEARGSSSTWADWSRMKPQFAQVSGNASVPRSTAALPATCSSATRSSQPCQSSPPQKGHAMRASRLRKKSKMRFVASPICLCDRRRGLSGYPAEY